MTKLHTAKHRDREYFRICINTFQILFFERILDINYLVYNIEKNYFILTLIW